MIFWFVAFTAAALFAAVLIAPKWEDRELLVARAESLAAQCRALSDSNHRLQQVIDAFKHDPNFTSEMARAELDYTAPDEERLPDPPRVEPGRSARQPPRAADTWAPLLHLFARDKLVRNMALSTAAVFAVVGLAFLHPPHEKTPPRRKWKPHGARTNLGPDPKETALTASGRSMAAEPNGAEADHDRAAYEGSRGETPVVPAGVKRLPLYERNPHLREYFKVSQRGPF